MRRLLLWLGVALVVLAGVVLIRTVAFKAANPPVPAPEDVPVDVDAAARRLSGAIRIRTIARTESPRYDPATFAALHRYLAANYPLVHTRLSTETVGRHSLLFTWKGRDPGKKPILLMAHQDVVPVDSETLDAWTHPPFSGAIEDGFIWGRGTLDVKQSVLGILEAAELLLKDGFQPERTVYFAFGHDEEIGGEEGAKAIAALLQKRGVKLAFVVDEGGVMTKGIVPDVDDWVALIGVAEKGYASLSLTTFGDGGHSSMPPQHTAIGVLADAVTRLEARPFPPRLEGSKVFFDAVAPRMPFAKRMIFANLWLFKPLLVGVLSQKPTTNATIRTTTAVTVFRAGVKDNVLPTRAEAIVNLRIMPSETPQSVKKYVSTVVDDDRIAIDFYGPPTEGSQTPGAVLPSTFSSTDGEGFVALSETIRQVAQDPGLVVAPYLVVGMTDSRHYASIADDTYRFLFNRFGPEDVKRMHGTNERISLENYAETIAFYTLFLKRAAGPSAR